MFNKIKDLFFNIDGRDRSGPAFGSVNRRLRDTEGLAARVDDRLNRAGRTMQKWGTIGSVASLGVAAAFRDVIGLYDEQARAEAKVAQAIEQTGAVAGFAAEDLFRHASALQAVTRFGDEAILDGVTAQLLTFKNISEEAFLTAQELALDLATVLNRDLTSTSIQLGKALNDPVKGLSALAESGIQFSASQQEVIKNLARTGQIAEAQRLILEEIASAYGGQAEAAREAGAGIVDAWRNTWGDLKEDVGNVVVGLLPPVVDALKAVTTGFENLSPSGQKSVVMFGALAVALPPVAAGLGLIVTGASALLSPLGLVLGGIAALTGVTALLWPEQDKVTQSTDLLTGALGDEITQSQLLQQALSGDISMSVSAAKQKLEEARSRHENVKAIIAEQRALKLQSQDYQSILGEIADTEAALNSLGFPSIDVAVPFNSEAFEAAQQRLASLRVLQQEYLAAGEEYSDQLERTAQNIAQLEEALADAENGMVTFGNSIVIPIDTAERLKETITGASGLNGSMKDLMAETEGLAASPAWDDVKGHLRDLVTNGASWDDTWRGIFGSITDHLFDLAFSPAWDALFENLSKVMSGAGSGPTGGGIGGVLGNIFSGVGSILGFNTGGDISVGGKAGIDRNVTVLRTSADERVSIRRPGDAMGGGGSVTVNIMTPNPQAFESSRAQIGHQIGRAVAMGHRSA